MTGDISGALGENGRQPRVAGHERNMETKKRSPNGRGGVARAMANTTGGAKTRGPTIRGDRVAKRREENVDGRMHVRVCNQGRQIWRNKASRVARENSIFVLGLAPRRNAMRAPRCRSSSFGKDLPPTAGITHNDDGRRHLPSLLPLSIAMSPRNPDMVDMSSVFLSCLLYSTREDMRLATNSRGKGGGAPERREERIIGRKLASPHAQGH